MEKYRIISTSGIYDRKSDSKDALIKFASHLRGVFTLWKWNGKQWRKEETFIF